MTGRVGTADDACRRNYASAVRSLFGIQTAGLGEHRSACRLDGEANFVFLDGVSFRSPMMAGKAARRVLIVGEMKQRAGEL
jgi:hypothetical protein